MGKVELSDVLKKLKMDDNVVDTTLAEEYLAEHTEFCSDYRYEDSETIAFDSRLNKVFCLPVDTLESFYLSGFIPIEDEQLQKRLDGLRKLAQAIENNTDLICQLEYLIRKIPVRETKYSIHLILQHLTYSADNKVTNHKKVILIQNDTPLLALGFLPGTIKLYDTPYLYATNETAVICDLFVKLCRQAELDCVKLVIGEKKIMLGTPLGAITYRKWFDDLLPEIVGVITDKSDLDSAVDVFLNSVNHPFPLAHIFVQESIYKEFKNILAWKCKSPSNVNLSLKANCADAFKCGNKVFYIDYAGNVEGIEEHQEHRVFVEAYRTVNELFSLLKKTHKRLCLSLWASDVSEANEIALNISVPIVWINDCYNFNGPNKISQVIFDKTGIPMDIICDEKIIKELIQKQKVWMGYNFNERYEKVVSAFKTVNEELGVIINLNSSLLSDWKSDDYVTVQDKTIIFGFHLPLPIVSYDWNDNVIDSNISNSRTSSVWLSIVKALVNGSAFIYRTGPGKYDYHANIFQRLANFGIPIAEIKKSDNETSNTKIKTLFSHLAQSAETKVIWTNFGTRFAN